MMRADNPLNTGSISKSFHQILYWAWWIRNPLRMPLRLQYPFSGIDILPSLMYTWLLLLSQFWIWRAELWLQVLVAIWQFDIYHDPGADNMTMSKQGASPGHTPGHTLRVTTTVDKTTLTLLLSRSVWWVEILQCGDHFKWLFVTEVRYLRPLCMCRGSGVLPSCVRYQPELRWIESKQVWDQGRQ